MATSRQLREQIAAGRWDAALAALYCLTVRAGAAPCEEGASAS